MKHTLVNKMLAKGIFVKKTGSKRPYFNVKLAKTG